MALILTGSSGSTTLDSSAGLTFSDSSNQQYAAGPYVLKNRIINGSMQIWQRGTSITVPASTWTYAIDRWTIISNLSAAGTTTVSQSTSVPTVTTGNAFQYSAKVQRPSGSTSTGVINLVQVVESVNMYDLAGQTVTLSFWMKAGANFAGGSIIPLIQTGTVADQGSANLYTWTGISSPVSGGTITPTTTWTKYTATGTIPSNALELAVSFNPTGYSGTAGADDSYYITGVQLEIGTSATPFERRLYDKELVSCQRYYEVGGFFNVSYGSGGTSIGSTVKYAVVKRAAPTFTQTSTSNTNCSATPANASTGNNTESILSYRTGASGGSQYSETWIASAEL